MAAMPIESLNLSVRTTNVLHRMNIHEVEQLLNTPMEHIFLVNTICFWYNNS